MTLAERVDAVAAKGFTERQAGFLVQVMLHAGVCVGRQYCAYARIARGQKVADFFQKLVQKRYATPYPCGHNKARVYHLHHIALYDAIGEPHARFRKRMALGRAVERLMVLDHVIAHRDLTWLGSEQDKLAHFLTAISATRDELPRLAFGAPPDTTVRFFPDKLPIGVSADQRSYVLPYVVSRPWPYDFRAFLRRHAALLRTLPSWCVRLLIPSPLRVFTDAYSRAFQDELGRPLAAPVAEEFRWFCRLNGRAAATDQTRAQRARRAFGSPRFRALQRAWLLDGDRVIELAMSTALADAIARGQGRLECHELSRQYLHLSPLVGSS